MQLLGEKVDGLAEGLLLLSGLQLGRESPRYGDQSLAPLVSRHQVCIGINIGAAVLREGRRVLVVNRSALLIYLIKAVTLHLHTGSLRLLV